MPLGSPPTTSTPPMAPGPAPGGCIVPEVIDLADAADPEASARHWMEGELSRPARRQGDTVLALHDATGHALIRLSEHRHWWFARFHHIGVDGYSVHAFIQWVARVYTDPAALEESPFTDLASDSDPLPVRREDPAADSSWEEVRDFWTRRADILDTAGSLCETTAPARVDHHDLRQRMDPDAVEALIDFATETGSTWIEMSFALIGTYSQSYLTDRPAVLGIPWLNRPPAASDARAVAPRVNVLPLCLPAVTDPGTTVAEFAAAVRNELTAVRAVQRYRTEWLRRDLGKSGAGHRLHGPTINIRPFDRRATFGPAAGTVHNIRSGPTEDLDIALSLDADGGLEVRVLANPDLYSVDTAQRHLERITDLLERTPREGPATLGEIPLMLPAERDLVMNTFNDTGAPATEHTLPSLLIEQLGRAPAAPALLWQESSLDYQELFHGARRLAAVLGAHGAGPGDTVGVHLQRGPAMVLSLLATTLAGAAYAPLDPALPASRLDSMVGDLDPAVIITGNNGGEAPGPAGIYPLVPLSEDTLDCLDHLPAPAAPEAATGVGPEDTAYIIFTSGSTGAPKGTAVSHRAIVNRLLWMQHEYALDSSDIVLQKTPFSFDVSVWEFFWAFMAGARLAIAEHDVHRDPEALARTIIEHGVTTCHFVPSALSLFTGARSASRCTSLRRVFCSGEALDAETGHRLLGMLPVELHNLYGPTEAAVDVTFWHVSATERGPVPIGRPVWNTRTHVLDALGRPLPPGVAGHLHLAGIQLAQGYVRRPELTVEKFYHHPGLERLMGRPERVYATGDIARWRSDGALEYLGRIDDQVKMRGLRIELGEIEAVLAAHPMVERAVVVPHGSGPSTTLRGYVQSPGAVATELRAWLTDRLPDYMVPHSVDVLVELPLTANGKLDRRSLPKPEAGAPSRTPSTPLEGAIARAFATVLDQPDIGVETNFFDAGGTSLTAVSLLRRLEGLHETLSSTSLELSDIFAGPTVAALARRLGSGVGANPYARVLTLRAHRRGTPVFCLHPAGGLGWSYANLLRHITPDTGIHALQAPGLDPALPAPAPPASIHELASDFAQAIIELVPEGPVSLLGWSVGGVIAQELAIELTERSVTVERLVLLDAYPPESWQQLAEPTAEEINEALLIMGGVDHDRQGADLSRESVLDLLARTPGPFGELADEVVARVASAVSTNAALMRSHTARRYDGDIDFFTALRKSQNWLHVSDWRPHVGGNLRNHDIDCSHPALIHHENLAHIVGELGLWAP